jgi:hypothetical protein
MPLLDLFWSMFMFFLWVGWFWLLITVVADIFRSEDLSGWSKAAWSVFALVLPFLGVFLYVIARGHSMPDRALRQQQQVDAANASYIRGLMSSPSTTEELARLSDLHHTGALNDEEYATQKAKLLTT